MKSQGFKGDHTKEFIDKLEIYFIKFVKMGFNLNYDSNLYTNSPTTIEIMKLQIKCGIFVSSNSY